MLLSPNPQIKIEAQLDEMALHPQITTLCVPSALLRRTHIDEKIDVGNDSNEQIHLIRG